MKQDHPPKDPLDHPESRRSGPPPPPSRRASLPSNSAGASSEVPASDARPTTPGLSHSPPLSHTPLPPPARSPSSIPPGPLKPRLGSTPIAELNRARDPVRALHERELEHQREQHQQALAQAQLDKEAELAALELSHQTQIQALVSEQQAQLQAVRAQDESNLISMRRRLATAAHLALEDRQGLLRYLDDENQQLRARVHELEQQLGLPATVFSDRPRVPSLPPEIFISPTMPPPGPEAVGMPSAAPRAAATAPDDLTRLRGVGPAIARGLVRLGVTKFSQIASWTDADIERIAPQLRTRPHRIRKDGWVKWAQRLQEGQRFQEGQRLQEEV
ncbi:MAG TPA: hypothetical protein VN764_04860 [Polyangiaceae bacterium]|nr:hypothetical protein [Polyangiaceae bacterium]